MRSAILGNDLNMVSGLRARDFKITQIMGRFTAFKTVRMEQRKCLTNRGKDVFAIIPTDFEKMFDLPTVFSLSSKLL